MAKIIDAIYENGVIRPLDKLDLPEQKRLRIMIEEVEGVTYDASERERVLAILRGVGLCQWSPEESARFFGSLPPVGAAGGDKAFAKLDGKLSEEIIRDRGDY